jgi:hypothetical protein
MTPAYRDATMYLKSACSTYLLCAALLLFGLMTAAHAAYFNDDPPTLNAVGCVSFDSGLSATIVKRLDGKSWWGEKYAVLVKSADKKIDVSFPFESSYGRFRAYFPNLRELNQPNLVLVTSRGKGTSAASYYLDIYEIHGSTVTKAYEMQISEYYGPGELWWYDVSFEPTQSDKDDLVLNLNYSESTGNPLEDISLIPKTKEIRIAWDSKTEKYIEREK